jgi:hypothetical protein
MPVEKKDTCLGNAWKEIKKEEVNITFGKRRSRMLRKKAHNIRDL